MNPHQKNKIDITKMSPEEQKLFRMYGKVPNRKDLLQNKLKERKYFDSGDYALSKAGKAADAGVTSIGHEHPNPENIPHSTTPLNGAGSNSVQTHGLNSSPVKESSYLQRETSASDMEDEENSQKTKPDNAVKAVQQ